MTYADALLPEFDHEMASTRRMLESTPADKMDFKAGPQFQTIGWNANHVAEIVGWAEGVFTEPSFDIAPVDGPRYESPELASPEEVLNLFDNNVASARNAIQAADESRLNEPWSLLQGGQPLFTMPRHMVIRLFVLNHLIHHRAFLCAQLRLAGVDAPGMYGP